MTNTTTADTNVFGENLTSGLSKGVRYTLLIVFSVILLLGILNGYRMCAYGMNFSDEPYHIINAMDYKNAPMTVLNALIGHAFGNIFGWNYLNFRYLAWTFDLLAILTAGSFLLWKTRDWLVSVGFTSSIVVYESISPLLFRLYGWDCLAALILTVILCFTLYYCDRPKKAILILLSIITGLAILIKASNVVLVPVISAFIWWKFRKISEVAVFSSISIILAATGIIIIYGSPSVFIQYLHLNSNPEHGSIITLLKVGLIDVVRILPYITFYLALFYTIFKISNAKLWMILIAMALCIAVNHYINIIHFGEEARLIWPCIAISVIVVAMTKNLPVGFILFAVSYISVIGSDRGLLKFVSFSTTLVALAYIVNRQNLKTAVICGTVLFLSSSVFRYSKASASSFGDAGLPYLTETANTPYLIKGMRTTPHRIKHINNTIELCGPNQTFVVGDSVYKYFYELILSNINPYLRQGWGRYNNFQKQWYVDSIESHVSRSPRGMQYLYLSNDTTTLMYGMLHEKMPLQRRSDDFILFVKE